MTRVGTYELKTHASRLMRRVRAGESIGITWHGRLIARIVPAEEPRRLSRAEAIRRLRAHRRPALGDTTIRALITEGRTRRDSPA